MQRNIRSGCGMLGLSLWLAGCAGPSDPSVPVVPGSGRALTPPADEAFVPLACGAQPSWDPLGDTAGGSTGRDLVGDATFPAILRADGDGVAYFRMRLDTTPLQPGGALQSFGWLYEFDGDGDVTSYEKTFVANGVGADRMEWWDNVQNNVDDPRDPPETLLRTYSPSEDFWAVTDADSSFGSTPDYFLTIAVLQSDLATFGVTFSCKAQIWAGTSNTGQVLDNDLVCHDGAASAATLSGAWIGPVPDPMGLNDIDGDGLSTGIEEANALDPCDPDSDEDGVVDGADGITDTDGDGVLDALDPDSDDDGLPDGLEAGVTLATAPDGTDVGSAAFRADDDPATTTDPKNPDTDGDGLVDGTEDANATGGVDAAETDPNDPDTDDGGVEDGEEAGRGTDPLAPRDDFHAAGSGGCACRLESSSGPGAGAAGLLLLSLVPFLLARRRARTPPGGAPSRRGAHGLSAAAGILAAFASAFLQGGGARAQSLPASRDFEVQQFRPVLGYHDLLGIGSPRVPAPWTWTMSLQANHAARPLRLIDPSDGSTEAALVQEQSALDVGASLALPGRMEITAAMPVTMARTPGTAPIASPAVPQEPAYSGAADLRIFPKLRILERGSLRLGAAAPFSLPTARASQFLGHGGPTFSPRLLAEWGGEDRPRLVANAGWVLRERREFLNLRVDDALLAGLAAEAPFSIGRERVALLATVQGEQGLHGGAESARPVEALAGAIWHTRQGFDLTLAAGRGLTDGYGAPTWRAVAGVSFSPDRRRREAAPPPMPSSVAIQGDRFVLRETVLFPLDESDILPASYPLLDEVAGILADHPRIRRLRIEGHTDDQGTEERNRVLSERRAQAVRDYLIRRGIRADRLEAKGFGATMPIDTNETEAGRARNRRVEFVILEMDGTR